MNKLLVFAIACISPFLVEASQDSLMLSKIYNESFYNGEAYSNLRILTKDIGHRIAGSDRAKRQCNGLRR